MSKPLDNATITIPPGTNGQPGVYHSYHAGVLFYVLSATAPFQMQFDNDTPFTAQGGFIFGNSSDSTNYQRITFYNANSYPITVTYYSGRKGVGYIGTNQTKVASTFTLGSLGLASSGTYNGQAITISTSPGGVPGILLTTNKILVSGSYNGSQRKGIVFSNMGTQNANSTQQMVVTDPNANVAIPIGPGASMYLETDSNFIIYNAAGGSMWLSTLEIYYKN